MTLASSVKLTAAAVTSLAMITVFAEPASAQGSQGLLGNILNKDPSQLTRADLVEILVRLIRYALAFAAAIGALSIVVNGYQYVLASGNPEKLEKAKMGLTWSITGFILTASSFAIVFLLQRVLQAKQPVTRNAPNAFGTAFEAATVLEQIFILLSTFGGLVAVIYLIIGGYRYTTSQGNQDLVEKAKKTILYSLIGIIVILSAVGIYVTLSSQLGQPNPI